jgi:hypothetical protein
VHPIDEQVRIAVKGQAPRLERLVVGLPLLGEPLDRAGRQPRRVLAQQIAQRRGEVPCRQARRYKTGSTSVTFGDLRAYAGRIFELNL